MSILVLEASTTSAKAMLYDGGVLREYSVPYESSYSDIVSQDAQCVYEAVIAAGKAVSEGFNVDAVSVGGTWHSFMVVDSDMRPRTRAYSWAYTGAAAKAAALRADPEFTERTYHNTGCMVHAIYPVYKLLMLKESGFVLNKGDRITGQGSYIFAKLTGRLVESRSMVSGSGFLNIEKLDWDDDQLELCGITPDFLPPLVGHEDVYPLSGDAAAQLGVKPGIPVVPAHPDGALNQVGAGAMNAGKMTLSVGTSGALRMPNEKPAFADGAWCYYAPGKRLVGAAVSGCTNCIDWLVKTVLGSKYSYSELETLAAEEKGDLPVFLPFLFGERCPGWRDSREGGFYGVKGSHGPGALYLSILLGVSSNLYQCYKILENCCGTPKEVHLSGGILKSKLWTGLLTDMFGRDFIKSDSSQASMLGAACLAQLATGDISDINDFGINAQCIRIENKNSNSNRQYLLDYYERYNKAYNEIL